MYKEYNFLISRQVNMPLKSIIPNSELFSVSGLLFIMNTHTHTLQVTIIKNGLTTSNN